MYELLLGLKDSASKEISPQGYIEAAEQFKRSTRVDLWVISEVLTWMRDNPAALARIATLNVNLSGSSLSDDSFMLGLESNLRANPELAHKLCFEVTETSAVANLHFASDFMREMKRLNCRFALDDFGTGLSSYAYLQKLPVDFVKIDGIFVKDMADQPHELRHGEVDQRALSFSGSSDHRRIRGRHGNHGHPERDPGGLRPGLRHCQAAQAGQPWNREFHYPGLCLQEIALLFPLAGVQWASLERFSKAFHQ